MYLRIEHVESQDSDSTLVMHPSRDIYYQTVVLRCQFLRSCSTAPEIVIKAYPAVQVISGAGGAWARPRSNQYPEGQKALSAVECRFRNFPFRGQVCRLRFSPDRLYIGRILVLSRTYMVCGFQYPASSFCISPCARLPVNTDPPRSLQFSELQVEASIRSLRFYFPEGLSIWRR